MFDWHPRDALRYQIWFPGAHAGVRCQSPSPPGAKPDWGAVHFPTEDVGLGMTQLRIEFIEPTQLGFATNGLDDPRIGTIIGGYVGDQRRGVRHTLMVHVFLVANDGLVLRSRFWIGAVIQPCLPKPLAGLAARALNRSAVRTRMIPAQTARRMAAHCAAEYANLGASTALP